MRSNAVLVRLMAVAMLLLGSVSARSAGEIRIRGRVTDAQSGRAVGGVVVSDGTHCVQTDRRGRYILESDTELARNIFVIMPEGYECAFDRNGLWNGFIPFDDGRKTYDFSIARRGGTTDSTYRILLLGDPQQMSSRPHSAASWKHMCNALREYRATTQGPLYQILLGDMITNEIEVDGMPVGQRLTIRRLCHEG